MDIKRAIQNIAQIDAIQLDEEHGIIPLGQGVWAGARLGVTINRHGSRNRWQRGQRGDGLHACTRDIEGDGHNTRRGVGVGIENGLAQGAGAGVGGSGDGEGGGEALVCDKAEDRGGE